ncbi:ATP-dependent DNA helicase RecG [Salinisphaera sp. USBA-960]|nr:ATP-dependent DNA helicase RecG [Salifodinibacter halophilus]NNC26808.1 ATP-dependent DNA helicase RecG [Salifodinibacter halophilus]
MPSSSSANTKSAKADPGRPCRASDSVQTLAGVGPKLTERLTALGIVSVGDLLLHRPLRYEDRTQLTPVRQLVAGEPALVLVRVINADVRIGRRRSLCVDAEDDSGHLLIRLFHFSPSQQARFTSGAWLRLFGQPRASGFGVEMVHPEIEFVAGREEGQAFEPALVPVYPATAGLTQKRLRGLVDQALDALAKPGFWPDQLPADLAVGWGKQSPADALRLIHAPSAQADCNALIDGQHPAVARLAFEELLAHQLQLRARRQQVRGYAAPRLGDAGRGLAPLFDQLGFAPTDAQRRVIGEILADMAVAHPMLRLLQGDVGSGKTVVAAAAVLTAVENGWQAALMAPTEMLAQQHYETLSAWLEPLGVAVWRVTGKRARSDEVAQTIAAGSAGVAVGTHALFEKGVDFGRLGLCVVDEQHRFGVDQRLALTNQAGATTRPHQLIMTATPIPRTLAMSHYADLDTSTIDTLPPGRTPIATVALPNTRRDEIIERIGRAVADGRQVYWVCTLIEDSDKLEAQAAEASADLLAQALPNARIGLAHGRLANTDKQNVMTNFASGMIDVLVATTVIEVGVDVPNASLMIIENAERLGLAQLHQLRGRVGRGSVASHCVLVYQPPLSETARQRLIALRDTGDGFEIARADLALRGPGEVLGTRQTGAASFRIADLGRDQALAESAARQADDVLAYHPREAEALIERWTAATDDYVAV